VQDLVGGMAGSNLTYDDANGQLDAASSTDTHAEVQDDGSTVDSDPGVIDFQTGLGASDTADGVDVSVEDEHIEDTVNALLSAGDKLSLTYDDQNDQLTVDTSALDEEEVEDAVAALLTTSGNLALSYDDQNDQLTISLSGPIEGVQIGSSTNRSDAYFATADANTVNTDSATIKGGDIGTSSNPVEEVNTDVVGGAGRPYSTSDDLSDVSITFQRKSPTSTTEFTLVDVSDGPKTVIDGYVAGGSNIRTHGGNPHRIGTVTIDGNSIASYPTGDTYLAKDGAGNGYTVVSIPPTHYDSSIKVQYEHSGDGLHTIAYLAIAGSGPHSAAIVADGEPVYSVHYNLNEEQIDQLTPPDGHKVVRNPGLSHPDPMVRGEWDDTTGTCQTSDFRGPFYDTLDRLRALSAHFGRQPILDRSLIGYDVPQPDPDGTPKQQAMAHLEGQWRDDLPDAI